MTSAEPAEQSLNSLQLRLARGNWLGVGASCGVVLMCLCQQPVGAPLIPFGGGQDCQRNSEIAATGEIISGAVSVAQGLGISPQPGWRLPPGQQACIRRKQEAVLTYKNPPITVAR